MLFDSCTGMKITTWAWCKASASSWWRWRRHPPVTPRWLQGSGSFAVEGVLGTVIGPQDKLLIVNNGAYGARMIEMARLMDIDHHAFDLRRGQ